MQKAMVCIAHWHVVQIPLSKGTVPDPLNNMLNRSQEKHPYRQYELKDAIAAVANLKNLEDTKASSKKGTASPSKYQISISASYLTYFKGPPIRTTIFHR